MLNALILDDTPEYSLALNNFLCKTNKINVVGIVETVAEAVKIKEKNKIDVAFVDIHLRNETGFDFIDKVDNSNMDIVFVTIYEHYAVKAFRYAAIDYLIKPVSLDDVEEAVDKITKNKDIYFQSIQLNMVKDSLIHQANIGSKIGLFVNQRIEIYNTADIIYCKGEGVYTHFYLKNNAPLLVSKNLKYYQDLLPPETFFRPHKSFLVNINEIKKYIKLDGGYVVMSNGDQLPVSKKQKQALFNLVLH